MKEADEHDAVRKRASTAKNKALQQEFENKLVINEDIEVTEYSPDVFAFLR